MLRREAIRKSIHMLGFTMVSLYMHSPYIALSLLVVLLAIYCVSEYIRLRLGINIPVVSKVTSLARREDEPISKPVMAPAYLALGILITLITLPQPANYVGIAVVTLGDGSASIVGRAYGRHRIPYTGKSVEGSLAFFVVSMLGSMLLVQPLIALMASLVGVAVEQAPLPINDNITIPLLTGAVVLIAMG